jgi:putative ABC transport system permease protein
VLILALQTLRARRSAAAGTFVALAFAVALLTACGILVQTGLDAGAPVDRYAAAPIVVAGPATMREPGGVDLAVRLPEPARVPLVLVPRLAAVEGVRSVVVDRAVPVTLAGGRR